MAGDWIKMRTNLDTDPAVVRIASGLEADRYSVVGKLHRIWSWANEHLTDGLDVPVDSAFLDSLVETPGFAEEMRHVGWLSGRDGSLCFPSFERHNGSSAKARAQDSLRKSLSRRSETCPGPNRTETGPEKRREEKSKKKATAAQSPKKKRFVKPSPEEIQAYCDERNNGLSGQEIWDHYEANGWIRGKTPIKDWKACVRTWEKNNRNGGQNAGKLTTRNQQREQANADAFAVLSEAIAREDSASPTTALLHEKSG